MASPSPKFIAELNHVCELGLFGAADLDWWRNELADQPVEPVEVDGFAQLLITGLAAKWGFSKFLDISVMITARSTFGEKQEGLFILSAFNASRFICFFEDKWFGLPYGFRKEITMDLKPNWTYRMGSASTPALHVGWSEREPESCESFDGIFPLFLPRRRPTDAIKWLQVRIWGETVFSPFDSFIDRCDFDRADGVPILTKLSESRFRPMRWHMRADGNHARTKTYKVRS